MLQKKKFWRAEKRKNFKMAAEIAEMPDLVSKIDLRSAEESEEDNVEIIITPKRKDTVCSVISVSSCEAADEDQGVGSQREDSSDGDVSPRPVDNHHVKFSDKLSAGFDASVRRDSGFSDVGNQKKKLTGVDSNASNVSTEDVPDPEGDADADAADAGEEDKEEDEEEDSFVAPDEELTKKIVDQVKHES